jgi:hypothetical protein
LGMAPPGMNSALAYHDEHLNPKHLLPQRTELDFVVPTEAKT